ncbi:hypothetical protein F9817_23505 [Vibrio sp. CAIM 722]|uniref:Uncharacterized protein n=1 Tax=Vibrio eleionomae TaxID=2653505 RepID=A0A7X4LQ45_9VIBR|nr:OmpH family outer membrane protein [Vibrio eleionomae]MZI96148.1 hypothetical protein [Vibrio eleionomae]
MATPQRIKIPRTIDSKVIDCFKKIGEDHTLNNFNVNALTDVAINNIDLFNGENEELESLLKYNSSLINNCSGKIGGLQIVYYRGGQDVQNKSAIFDEVLLTWNSQQGGVSNIDRLDIVNIINCELNAIEPGEDIDSGLYKEQSQLISIHNATLQRLEKLNEDLIKQSSNFRDGLEKRFDERSDELNKNIDEKRDKLEQEYKQKNDNLNKKEQAFSERLSAFDDRDNTHVRREIRDRMLDDVKARIEKFGVSASTEGKRRPVFWGIILLIAVITILLAYTIFEISFDPQINNSGNSSIIYWLWAKISIMTLALFGTILYYIKWQNRWAEQYANTEFQLQQFYIDVNRANWVIESCLEWRKETESEIPHILLESMTKNLFESNVEELEKVIHPSDELASALLGSASKLKMKVGDNEIEFDKPAKIKSKKVSSN